jgi:capsular exopolysaccharide synthesis family protein
VGLTGALLMDDAIDDLENLLTPTPVDNLWLLTSGQLPHNPSELLGSHKLKQLTEQLLRKLDILIFDSPPTLAVTDPVILGQTMDGVIIVVDAGITRDPALIHALTEMEKVNAHVLGIVLNRFNSKSSSGYYYYYDDRYYHQDDVKKENNGKKRRQKRSPKPSAVE